MDMGLPLFFFIIKEVVQFIRIKECDPKKLTARKLI